MTRRLGLRARLTIFVTVVFAAALTITSVVVVAAVEDRLVADTRASAEAVLGDYLESIYGGVATVGVVDPDSTTRFFYLDTDSREISEQEYFETIATSFDEQLADRIDLGTVAQPVGESVIGGSGVISAFGTVAGFAIDADSGALFGPDGASITLVAGPVPTGEPYRIDLGDDTVAVAQTLTFADDTTIEVGVSNPLQPVTDSLDTIVELLWFAVPALVAVTALITWQAASRALRPVDAIANQADTISATSIDQRVPLHDANDEIRQLGITVNNMLDRLQHAQGRQRQLVADASHELRSPVAASRAQLDVAIANPDQTDWPATANAVLAEQLHLTNLIDDLLALSRLDEATLGSTGDVDLDDLLATEAHRYRVVIETIIAEPVRITGNAALITRAIRNLLDNAVAHAEARITSRLETDHRYAIVHIDDDGPGIPASQRDEIFERFTRLDEARDRHSGGTGLGLAIARDVARAHHGDLICTTSPLGGARFTLTLPHAASTDRHH